MMRQCQNIFVAGAGLYSWFSDYSQDCIDQQACQKALVLLDSNFANVRFQHLVTIGAKYMAVMDGKGLPAADNLAVNSHPFWSHVSVLDVSSNGPQFAELVWIDPAIWDMEQPRFTCSPPCNVKIPPWTRATSTVNYPLLTVSDGSWTSTITKPPITISEWIFQAVTLTAVPVGRKRQAFQEFWPVPATTPYWPAVIYTGPDGNPTTTAPTAVFPTPPPSIGPNAPPPPGGNWPKRAIQPVQGLVDSPWVQECSWLDPLCITNDWIFDQPWKWGNSTGGGTGGDDGFFDENWDEAQTTCDPEASTTASTAPTATRTAGGDPSPPKHSPRVGDPTKNKVDCYNAGQRTEHVRLDGAANDFCNELRQFRGDVLGPGSGLQRPFDLPVRSGVGVRIIISLDVYEDCQWTWNYDECRRYLNVPVDSCDCSGVDGKHGGGVGNDCYYWRIDPNTAW